MSEPTLRDMHRAGTWLNNAFGDQATAGLVESLAWLIAEVRAEERGSCGVLEGEDADRLLADLANVCVRPRR